MTWTRHNACSDASFLRMTCQKCHQPLTVDNDCHRRVLARRAAGKPDHDPEELKSLGLSPERIVRRAEGDHPGLCCDCFDAQFWPEGDHDCSQYARGDEGCAVCRERHEHHTRMWRSLWALLGGVAFGVWIAWWCFQ